MLQISEMDEVPLGIDQDGVIRVGGTRVTFDSVLAAYNAGATPEEIVQQFPTLHLASVYGAISYYLRRPDEIRDYLRERLAVAEQVRLENERQFDPQGIRQRLLARRSSRSNPNAAPGV